MIRMCLADWKIRAFPIDFVEHKNKSISQTYITTANTFTSMADLLNN